MKISVVICAYNEESYIRETLQSVVENSPDNLLEIIVVNNASTDKTAEVASAFPKVRVVNEPSKGLTRARQAGLLAASGELMAYIDADCRVSREWFAIIDKEFKIHPDLVCLSGPYDYYDLSASKKFVVAAWYRIAKFFSLFIGYLVQGGNFVAKKSALMDMGGFDANIAFYGEDTDIAKRISKFGKVKILMRFTVQSSARRLLQQGLLKTGWIYAINFLSVIFIKRPVTKHYGDYR